MTYHFSSFLKLNSNFLFWYENRPIPGEDKETFVGNVSKACTCKYCHNDIVRTCCAFLKCYCSSKLFLGRRVFSTKNNQSEKIHINFTTGSISEEFCTAKWLKIFSYVTSAIYLQCALSTASFSQVAAAHLLHAAWPLPGESWLHPWSTRRVSGLGYHCHGTLL